MDNQHKKISGYRDLDQAELDLMNKAKLLEKKVGQLFQEFQMMGVNGRHLALARTNLEQGFMWMVRSVAQPLDVYTPASTSPITLSIVMTSGEFTPLHAEVMSLPEANRHVNDYILNSDEYSRSFTVEAEYVPGLVQVSVKADNEADYVVLEKMEKAFGITAEPYNQGVKLTTHMSEHAAKVLADYKEKP